MKLLKNKHVWLFSLLLVVCVLPFGLFLAGHHRTFFATLSPGTKQAVEDYLQKTYPLDDFTITGVRAEYDLLCPEWDLVLAEVVIPFGRNTNMEFLVQYDPDPNYMRDSRNASALQLLSQDAVDRTALATGHADHIGSVIWNLDAPYDGDTQPKLLQVEGSLNKRDEINLGYIDRINLTGVHTPEDVSRVIIDLLTMMLDLGQELSHVGFHYDPADGTGAKTVDIMGDSLTTITYERLVQLLTDSDKPFIII